MQLPFFEHSSTRAGRFCQEPHCTGFQLRVEARIQPGQHNVFLNHDYLLESTPKTVCAEAACACIACDAGTPALLTVLLHFEACTADSSLQRAPPGLAIPVAAILAAIIRLLDEAPTVVPAARQQSTMHW
jgi:hypothetical protein